METTTVSSGHYFNTEKNWVDVQVSHAGGGKIVWNSFPEADADNDLDRLFNDACNFHWKLIGGRRLWTGRIRPVRKSETDALVR